MLRRSLAAASLAVVACTPFAETTDGGAGADSSKPGDDAATSGDAFREASDGGDAGNDTDAGDAGGVGTLTPCCTCAAGATCAFSCGTSGSACSVTCLAGSTCTVRCGDAGGTVTCSNGATCDVQGCGCVGTCTFF